MWQMDRFFQTDYWTKNVLKLRLLDGHKVLEKFSLRNIWVLFFKIITMSKMFVTVSDALHSFNLCTRTCERLGYTLIVHKVNQLKLCW